MIRIGIVAGEASGDHLGADLLKRLKQHHPNLIIEGIGGPQMIAQGCRSLFPMEALSVMGIWEVAQRLPKILTIRYKLIRYFQKNPPDIFIGIDAPDFNLTVEEKLKKQGIPTLHYVSPTVWAWKQWRIKKIARAVDKMLTLLPFEAQFYEQHQVPVKFVGHPLADSIPLEGDQLAARKKLNLPLDKKIIAILPGSRSNEIKHLAELFLKTALWCQQDEKNLFFIAPMANPKIRSEFSTVVKAVAPHLSLQIIDGQAQEVMLAADVVLLASGTVSLEAMLTKRPMVVVYRMSNLSFAIAKRMIKTKYISLPNLLANKALVPELIQHQATVKSLGSILLGYLRDPESVKNLVAEFHQLHSKMRCNSSELAAQEVLKLVGIAPHQ